jgi:hypothetical protein
MGPGVSARRVLGGVRDAGGGLGGVAPSVGMLR